MCELVEGTLGGSFVCLACAVTERQKLGENPQQEGR